MCRFFADTGCDPSSERLGLPIFEVVMFFADKADKNVSGAVFLIAALLGLSACDDHENRVDLTGNPSSRLLIFAGDTDASDSDFLVVIDADPKSDTRGLPLHSLPVGMKNSMPHHMEYVPPPSGEPLFMNAHHHESTLIVDIDNPDDLKVRKVLPPPQPFRFPHDYTRTSYGTRLTGFLRSDGSSPDVEEKLLPANHGGIAEYSADGELLRMTSAAVTSSGKAVRPYAFAFLPEADRFVVTSAPMMETSWAEVVQIYRYSDFSLLKTIELPKQGPGTAGGGPVKRTTGFGPRVLEDGSVFISTFECSFHHLTGIGTDNPEIELVHILAPASSGHPADHCGIPVQIGNFWIQPAGKINSVAVLDLSNPQQPEEVHRLETPEDFKPHWLSKDPKSNRLILGAELGGEQGFYVLRVDEATGALDFDSDFQGVKSGRFFSSKTSGYVSLQRRDWPHGASGDAWGHAALFLDTTGGISAAQPRFDGFDGDGFLFAGACLF